MLFKQNIEDSQQSYFDHVVFITLSYKLDIYCDLLFMVKRDTVTEHLLVLSIAS